MDLGIDRQLLIIIEKILICNRAGEKMKEFLEPFDDMGFALVHFNMLKLGLGKKEFEVQIKMPNGSPRRTRILTVNLILEMNNAFSRMTYFDI